jgi:hypothetical protein
MFALGEFAPNCFRSSCAGRSLEYALAQASQHHHICPLRWLRPCTVLNSHKQLVRRILSTALTLFFLGSGIFIARRIAWHHLFSRPERALNCRNDSDGCEKEGKRDSRPLPRAGTKFLQRRNLTARRIIGNTSRKCTLLACAEPHRAS